MAARCGSLLQRQNLLLMVQEALFKHSSKILNAKFFQTSCRWNFEAEEALEGQENNKIYGYIDGRRDKNTEGLLYLGMVKLPEDLKESYVSFCKRYPKKTLTEDGQMIARHLRNRGRPTEHTWKKYKETKTKVHPEVSQFSMENSDGSLMGDKFVPDDEITEKEATGTMKHDPVDNMLISKRESKIKAPRKAQYSVIRYGKREIAAFASSRVPACFGTTKRVFNEIARRDPDFKPKTLLDFGSGTGTAIWAARDIWGQSLTEYQCIDVSEDANKACEYLLRGGTDPLKPLKIPGVYFRRFLPLSNKVTYDVVVSAYTLSELPFRKQRQFALSNLWAKAKDYLVLVEPGNNEGFDIMLQARNYVTKGDKDTEDVFTGYTETDEGLPQDEMEFMTEEEVDKGYVFAPCPHDVACPRSVVEARDHPCNFEQKIQLAFSQRNTTLKRWGYATERFTYIILRKGERNIDEQAMSRLLEPPKRRRRHVICNICNSNGNIEQHIFTRKKDPEMYKGVRHCSKWGDLMPVMDMKKPRKIITFDNEIIVNKDKEE